MGECRAIREIVATEPELRNAMMSGLGKLLLIAWRRGIRVWHHSRGRPMATPHRIVRLAVQSGHKSDHNKPVYEEHGLLGSRGMAQ